MGLAAAIAVSLAASADTQLGPMYLFSRVITSIVSFGLVYENGLLALGNFIGAGPTLKSLSWGRYYFHVLAPLTVFAGLDLASRAGSRWAASSPAWLIIGGITAAFVLFSAHHTFTDIQLFPHNDQGLLRYTFEHPKVTLSTKLAILLPVVWLSIVMVVLGCATAWVRRNDSSVWPAAFAGPLLCFVLCSQARGRKWVENLGEVLLMSSTVYLQHVLTASVN